MTAARDRRRALVEGPARLNGIDFVVFDGEALVVHFLTLVSLRGKALRATITGGWPTSSTRVLHLGGGEWSSDDLGRPVLRIPIESPGDASTYALVLEGDHLDPFLARSPFSFQGFVPRAVDCEAPRGVTVPAASTAPTIDYLAKDFTSFKQVLLDFSAQNYPTWQERSEADFGIMFLEALSSIADDLSYQQDRVANEAFLATATERVSLVRHARLVDYEPRPATAARVMLQFTVTAGPIPSGLKVSAVTPDGSIVDFETGAGLADITDHPASPLWNELTPYWWDDSASTLGSGATEMWLTGGGLGLSAGVALLLETETSDPTAPLRQQIVLTGADEEEDSLFGQTVTHLYWSGDDGLEIDRDLSRTVVRGNLVPATQGSRFVESFAIGTALGATPAILRTGANGSDQYLYSLRNAPLAWLAPVDDATAAPLPEIRVVQTDSAAEWTWSSSLLDADGLAPAYTVDPMAYRPVGPVRQDGTIPMDYAGSDGDTVRFGDGTYGMVPLSSSVFEVLYRAGGGAAGNVAADTITRVEPGGEGLIVAVTNPFPATGGADEESADDIRRFAPYAFSDPGAVSRAVTPDDFKTIAQSLPWVQEARTTFRYTGSWTDALTRVAADDTRLPSDAELRELATVLDGQRLLGRTSYVLPPRYVALDLAVTVRVHKYAVRADVRTAVRKALSAVTFADGSRGMFVPGAYGFGKALTRADLESVILAIPGVDWISRLLFRRHGLSDDYEEMPVQLVAAPDEIFRIDGNPDRPDAGTVKVDVEGGRR